MLNYFKDCNHGKQRERYLSDALINLNACSNVYNSFSIICQKKNLEKDY